MNDKVNYFMNKYGRAGLWRTSYFSYCKNLPQGSKFPRGLLKSVTEWEIS